MEEAPKKAPTNSLSGRWLNLNNITGLVKAPKKAPKTLSGVEQGGGPRGAPCFRNFRKTAEKIQERLKNASENLLERFSEAFLNHGATLLPFIWFAPPNSWLGRLAFRSRAIESIKRKFLTL